MPRLNHHKPVSRTRKRIDARRRNRQQPPAPARLAARSSSGARPTGSASGLRTFEARRQFQASLQSARASLHQLRSGAQARHRRQRATPIGASQVQPGIRRALLHWFVSGRMLSFGLFLAATTALFYMFMSPAFYIQTVAVEGNTILEDHVVAGLVELESDWIWFIDKQQLIAQIKQNAYVEHAALELALPNRAVIHVSERRPEVRWQAGGTEYLVDGGGRVLDVARASEAGTLVIVDHSNPALQPNQYIDPDALKLAQSLAVRLPNELRFPPQLIGWDVALGIYIISPYGQTIVFGRSERLESKLAILNQLLVEDVRFSYLDLRPTYPYYRP
mgnify:CR=1 FL=1